MAAKGQTRVMRRLAQVGGAGVGFEVRPQGVDHLVAGHPPSRLQAQQLDQVGGAQAGPVLRGKFNAVDRYRETTEQVDVETARHVARFESSVQFHVGQCAASAPPQQAPCRRGTLQERCSGRLLRVRPILACQTHEECT